MAHKQNCNFFTGEACVCRGVGLNEIGWEKNYELHLPLSVQIPSKPVEIPDHVALGTDKALRVHFGIYYRLGEGN